jgi:hypothetical protein
MKTALLISMLVFALPVCAAPQSEGASQVSAISLAPSVELAAIGLQTVPAGSRLILKSLRPVGDLIEVVAISAATGVSITLHVGSEALKLSGLVIGGALVVTVVSAGFLLMAGKEAIAFIPNDICRSQIHHRNLSR